MSCTDGVVSNSEEEKSPEGVTQQNITSAWSKGKQSSEQGGYSSEASSEQGETAHMVFSLVMQHLFEPVW